MKISNQQNGVEASSSLGGPSEGGLRTRGEFRKWSTPAMPLVTVITVVRNGKEHLEDTIQSVLGQTYDNIEYIVLDGGSTDGTIDVIKKYDGQLTYWRGEPDKGIYDAMNKGIGLSNGDWINFMNAGDTFYSSDTIRLVMSNNIADADLIFGHCQMRYGHDFSLTWKAKNIEDLWKGMIFRHQSLFTRASVCKKTLFSLDYKIGADFAFIYSCCKKGFKFKNIDVVVSSVSAGGLSDTNIILAFKETKRAVVRYDNTLKVNIYFRWMIFFTYLKLAAKRMLPSKITNRARLLKYR